MMWVALALGVFFSGAFLCFATIGRPALTRIVGPAVTVIGCVLGLIPVATALAGGSVQAFRLPWSMPFGSIILEMDALSAVFVLPVLAISALAAIYGADYLKPFESRKDLASSWFFYNMLTGSMLLVIVARNSMLFLLAWELMSIASFFLVMFENEKDSVRRAGWTYLVATHIGTAFLLVMFVMLGSLSGTLDFAGFSISGAAPRMVTVIFLLAVIGFGTKAGFMPLHVWLPEAHPAAPSHVSAVMSGVMIKTGIYGLCRILTFLGPPPAWWGLLMVGIGVISGILGVLFALAQHDLKRLLAYHSVENIGIIALGIGVGLLGMSYGHPVVAFLGFAGALLHVFNHAIFKSLLFLGAGSVLHASGTREIDHLGGLLKRMPVTALVFLTGSVAICGLPPLNGFISEFMIYAASFHAVAQTPGLPVAALGASLIVICSLALIGGLAVACFTKAFGVIFLGEPRSVHAADVHEAVPAMRIPMAVLAAICLVVGLSGPVMLGFLGPAVGIMIGGRAYATANVAWAGNALQMITLVVAGLLVLALALAWVRSFLLSGRTVSTAVTWDCGYARPTPRMQYTASSFAEPLIRLFRGFLRTRRRFVPPSGFFPASSSFATETPDVYRERMYRPMFATVESFLARFRWIQHGRVNVYILYVVLALLVLLIWKLG